MDAKEALAKIKAAEQKAEQDVRQSQAQAGEILKESQQKNERLLNETRNKAKADGEKLQILNETEIREEISRLEKETEAEIRKIRKKAARAGDRPLAWIIAKIER
jgi:vacuolar-type H+-ATPase subunit H